MARKLLFMLLALMGLTTAVAADFYGIQIGGIELSSYNYQNISSSGGFKAVTSGTVTYDPTTKTLTLSGATIEVTSSTTSCIEFPSWGEDYNLVLANGTINTISANNGPALLTKSPLTIKGGGTCHITSANHTAIWADYDSSRDYTLDIQNCTITAYGRWGIGANGSDYGSLCISNSNINVTGYGWASLADFKNFTLTNASITQPAGAAWDNSMGAVCVDGTKVTSEVVIEATSPALTLDMLNPERYDVNGNGTVTLADLTLLANALVGKVNYYVSSISLSSTSVKMAVGLVHSLTATVYPTSADYKQVVWSSSDASVASVDSNGKITSHQAGTCTITATSIDGSNRSASCTVTVVASTYIDGHEFVDLGLSSGTMWATCNVGASSPEQYGGYYAWGEIATKSDYSWATYTRLSNGTSSTLTKYNTSASYGYNGFTDGKTELEPVDDVAYVTWGTHWRVPSQEQWSELGTCSKKRTTLNGISVVQFTGPSGASIFLPAAGLKENTSSSSVGSSAYYWTRNLDSIDGPHRAESYGFNDSNIFSHWSIASRQQGRSVRAVYVP